MLCLVAQSCLTLCDLMDCSLPGSSVLGDSSGKNTGVGFHVLLQGVFPTQGSNPGLLHCRWILYQFFGLREGKRTLEWVVYPFSRGSSWPRNWTGVSCIAGGFPPSWTTREALIKLAIYQSEGVCLFIWYLCALHVQGPVLNFTWGTLFFYPFYLVNKYLCTRHKSRCV